MQRIIRIQNGIDISKDSFKIGAQELSILQFSESKYKQTLKRKIRFYRSTVQIIWPRLRGLCISHNTDGQILWTLFTFICYLFPKHTNTIRSFEKKNQ